MRYQDSNKLDLLGYIRSYDVAGQHTIAVRALLVSSTRGTEWRTGRVEANIIEVSPDLEPQCIQVEPI